MALTKVSTDGVKDDAITSGKIPANAVGASELADNAVDTNAIANNAVTAGKTSGVQTTINNNADNRVITGSGTANTLNGESSLSFDGSKLGVKTASPIGTLDVYDGTFCLTKPSSNSSSRNWRFLPDNVAAGNLGLQVSTAAGGSTFSNVIEIKSNGRVGIGDTNPQSKLAVSDGGSASDPVIMAHVANSNGGFLGFGLYSTINSAYTFKVSNNGRVTAKEGIIFGTDTAAANILDDYEEGSHTPADASGQVTFSSPTGHYTKIGRQVIFEGSVTWPSTGGQYGVGITLPFAGSSNGRTAGGGFTRYTNKSESQTSHVNASSSNFTLYTYGGQQIKNADMSGKRFDFVIVYSTGH